MRKLAIGILAGAAFALASCAVPQGKISEIEQGVNGDSLEVHYNGQDVEVFVEKGHDCEVGEIYTECLDLGDALVNDEGRGLIPLHDGSELGEDSVNDD